MPNTRRVITRQIPDGYQVLVWDYRYPAQNRPIPIYTLSQRSGIGSSQFTTSHGGGQISIKEDEVMSISALSTFKTPTALLGPIQTQKNEPLWIPVEEHLCIIL
ncbi:hypothetical protein Hanom_Chr13g01206271 [Helianthus anomalus]